MAQLYLAFVSNDDRYTFLAVHSAESIHWVGAAGDSVPISSGQYSRVAPALAVFHNQLYLAASYESVGVLVSVDGIQWSRFAELPESSLSSPALAVFQDRLYYASIAGNGSRDIRIMSSADGLNWYGQPGNASFLPIGQTSRSGPALAVFENHLYLAFVANNASNDILIVSSADGVHWYGQPGNTAPLRVGQSTQAAPALAVFENQLYLAFVANNDSHDLLMVSSADGIHWYGQPGDPAPVRTGQSSKAAPALAVFENQLYLAFVANNDSNNLLMVSLPHNGIWSDNMPVNQTTRASAALAVF